MYQRTTSFIRGMLPFSGAYERRELLTGGHDTNDTRNRVGSTLTGTMAIWNTANTGVSAHASSIDAPSGGQDNDVASSKPRISTSTDTTTSSAASSWSLVDVPDIAWPEDPFAFCLDPSVVSAQTAQSAMNYGLDLDMGERGLAGDYYGSNSEMRLPLAFEPFAAENTLRTQRCQMNTLAQQPLTYRPPTVYPWGRDNTSTSSNAPPWAVVQRPQRQIYQAPMELNTFERWELEKNIWAPRPYKARAQSTMSTLEEAVEAAVDDNAVRDGVECTETFTPADVLPLDHPLDFQFADLAIDLVLNCAPSEQTPLQYHRTSAAKTTRQDCA